MVCHAGKTNQVVKHFVGQCRRQLTRYLCDFDLRLLYECSGMKCVSISGAKVGETLVHGVMCSVGVHKGTL